jgi:hypothetical protein
MRQRVLPDLGGDELADHHLVALGAVVALEDPFVLLREELLDVDRLEAARHRNMRADGLLRAP